MNKQLSIYKGELSRDQLYQFFNNTLTNARNLFDEAKLLYNNKMLSRAYFLLCICTEEIGKAHFISAKAANINGDWDAFWYGVRKHQHKTWFCNSIEQGLLTNEAPNIPLDSPGLDQQEKFKMANLYSDVFALESADPLLLDTSQYVSSQLVETTINMVEPMLSHVVFIDG